MKIIISEIQYHNLFESNYEKNSNLIYKMWLEYKNLDEISDLVGIEKIEIIELLKDKKIPIDCSFAYDLIRIIFKTDLINKNYTFDGGKKKINLEWDFFTGAVVFEYHDEKYLLQGFATPYWNGECRTPVDGSYFEDTTHEDLYYDDYDGQGLTTSYTPQSFESISELIDFLNNDYPKLLIEPIEEILEYYKDRD